MFCHQYPTRACVAGNGEVRSLWDNVASSTRTATVFVRNRCDCQHRGGRELGSNGTVNRSESLQNVVTTNKPKVLRGLNQKVRGQEQGLQNLLSQTLCHRRKGETYPIHCYSYGTWEARRSPAGEASREASR